MTKRFRDDNGKLLLPQAAIKELTLEEARSYYKNGQIYVNMADAEEYVLLSEEWDPAGLAHFQSFDRKNLFIPFASLGTFLPDVASSGYELVAAEDYAGN